MRWPRPRTSARPSATTSSTSTRRPACPAWRRRREPPTSALSTPTRRASRRLRRPTAAAASRPPPSSSPRAGAMRPRRARPCRLRAPTRPSRAVHTLRPMAGLEDRTRFEPQGVDPRIVRSWLESGLHHPEPEGTPAENYSIAIPPPNVTGALHMGHALNGAIQDTLVRWARGEGRRTKWILGTDHAGIATQAQVEKQLRSEGLDRKELGREAFVERVWEWRRQYGGQIIEQYKRLGATCDYDDERFTMDPAYVTAVQKVFVELYEQGLIYRDNYMVNWDPGSHSAISDLEVEQREGVQDTLFQVRYSDEIVIATVRPESILADTAVAVHPDDDRYRHLV